jgi:hypothetical protein
VFLLYFFANQNARQANCSLPIFERIVLKNKFAGESYGTVETIIAGLGIAQGTL